jgi:hypothetical protein
MRASSVSLLLLRLMAAALPSKVASAVEAEAALGCPGSLLRSPGGVVLPSGEQCLLCVFGGDYEEEETEKAEEETEKDEQERRGGPLLDSNDFPSCEARCHCASADPLCLRRRCVLHPAGCGEVLCPQDGGSSAGGSLGSGMMQQPTTEQQQRPPPSPSSSSSPATGTCGRGKCPERFPGLPVACDATTLGECRCPHEFPECYLVCADPGGSVHGGHWIEMCDSGADDQEQAMEEDDEEPGPPTLANTGGDGDGASQGEPLPPQEAFGAEDYGDLMLPKEDVEDEELKELVEEMKVLQDEMERLKEDQAMGGGDGDGDGDGDRDGGERCLCPRHRPPPGEECDPGSVGARCGCGPYRVPGGDLAEGFLSCSYGCARGEGGGAPTWTKSSGRVGSPVRSGGGGQGERGGGGTWVQVGSCYAAEASEVHGHGGEEEEEEEEVAASAASGTTKALISVFVGVPLGVLLGVVGSQMFLDRRRKKYAGPFGEDVPNVSGHDDEKVVKRQKRPEAAFEMRLREEGKAEV